MSWSAKRITYPLSQDLRSTVAYISARMDVTVCLCFVSNLISFHIASRVGGVGCEVRRAVGVPAKPVPI